MKVKELIEELKLMDPEALVLIPQNDIVLQETKPYETVNNVASGFNEYDGSVFIEHCSEEDDFDLDIVGDGWGFLVGNATDHPNFFETHSVVEAILLFAEWVHGPNEMFTKCINTMKTQEEAIDLYNVFYSYDRPELIVKCHRSQIKEWHMCEFE